MTKDKWINEPKNERDLSLIVHSQHPFNAETPNNALKDMITAKKKHYRRSHDAVPLVDIDTYKFSIGFENEKQNYFNIKDLQKFKYYSLIVTLMCTGNRRSEYNNLTEHDTIGLIWSNGSISTAKYGGVKLSDLFTYLGIDLEDSIKKGYNFVTFCGIDSYKISIPIKKCSYDGDVLLSYNMNDEILPRDHGFPLRVIVPGMVGARSVKYLSTIEITKKQTDTKEQIGISYKQLPPNIKSLRGVSKEYIENLPPINDVNVISAITYPEQDDILFINQENIICGYALSGSGKAIIRVDISIDNGKNWDQAIFTRADETQTIRSSKAYAWIQWRYNLKLTDNHNKSITIMCKAIDDDYNQQSDDINGIWNIRGLLNNTYSRVKVYLKKSKL